MLCTYLFIYNRFYNFETQCIILIFKAMYELPLTSGNPGLILILIDQSWSMTQDFGGESKAIKAARAINSIIDELGLTCEEGEEIKDRFYLGVIGYGNTVDKILGGKISKVIKNPLKVENYTPIWILPKSTGKTPLAQAINIAYEEIILPFVAAQPDCFPPVVINITDGDPDDREINYAKTREAAERLKKVEIKDGKLLLFNAHISGFNNSEIIFPSSKETLIGVNPEEIKYAELLFDISSELPPVMVKRAQKIGLSPDSKSRGLVYNAKAATLIKLLNIGTLVTEVKVPDTQRE